VLDLIRPPWSERQVATLNRLQASGLMHPFTCGAAHPLHQTLIAETDGWHCPDESCDYRQDWAHSFMADPDAVAALIESDPLRRARSGADPCGTGSPCLGSGCPHDRAAAELTRLSEEDSTDGDPCPDCHVPVGARHDRGCSHDRHRDVWGGR
jgi:hypothetical protein